MFSFDPLYQPHPSNRYTLASRGGMVATSNALASAAGAELLRQGGNAVDAAVATAAALTVVEPTANGIGGDAFALVWMQGEGKVHGLQSGGCAPRAISREAVAQQHATMPQYGWTPITVPGAPAAWAALIEKFGNKTLAECLAPAIRYANEGFPVAATVAHMWERAYYKYKKMPNPDGVFDGFFRTFGRFGAGARQAKEGAAGAPKPFQMIALPDHAASLVEIGETNSAAFYRGTLAEAIDRASLKYGGYLRATDLAAHSVHWTAPISINYRGYDILELPPSNQGLVALMALNIMKNFPVDRRDALYYHRAMETMKLAFADGKRYITDPAAMGVSVSDLLSDAYAKERAALIGSRAQAFAPGRPHGSNTVYLATGDRDGNLVSMIQSNYMGFGSGVVVKNTGIALHNRGADFSLDPSDYNVLAPGKRTYHTIIPGMIAQNGRGLAAFGVMGAYMQPQGHFQVVSNLLDFHENPQMALDAPRWQWMQGCEFLLEDSFPAAEAQALLRRGHKLSRPAESVLFGRGQIILRNEDGVLLGGTESRTDGNIALV
uniref:gamma-glutamyltransferase family protein n=1 Tax=Ndongobacter massiliensis TaxID=1871025 RepID=UPI000931C0EA|nr:gamma-glutamyltransferase family protein [Ndongobacter massiliensis]